MADPRLLGPIPTPPAQRWREIRLLYLPRAVFLIGAVIAAVMWNRWVKPATLVAEAELEQAEVRATQPGVLASLSVTLLQPVRAGQTVGHLAAANPRLLEATLAVIRAEVGMLAATMTGATDRQRVGIEFERLQVDWLKGRVELAQLRGDLQQAEADLARAEPLHRSGIVTDDAYDQLKTRRQALTAQVAEQSGLVAHLESVIQKNATGDAQLAALSTDAALAAAIKVQDAKLKLAEAQLAPVPLLAPIDGVVAFVLRRPGETVVTGDTILRIDAAKPARLAGYLRQPLPFEPKVDMVAEIRTRANPPQVATTKVTGIGPAMEPISLSLQAAMHLPPTPAPESALRVYFAIPSTLTLRPGEHVDVTLQ